MLRHTLLLQSRYFVAKFKKRKKNPWAEGACTPKNVNFKSMGSGCWPRLGVEAPRGSQEKGVPNGRGGGGQNPATRPALAQGDQGRRLRSHAVVEPAAWPNSGPKAGAGPAIFALSPPPAPRAAAAAQVLSELLRPPCVGPQYLPCTYLVSSATFLTNRDVLGGRR